MTCVGGVDATPPCRGERPLSATCRRAREVAESEICFIFEVIILESGVAAGGAAPGLDQFSSAPVAPSAATSVTSERGRDKRFDRKAMKGVCLARGISQVLCFQRFPFFTPP